MTDQQTAGGTHGSHRTPGTGPGARTGTETPETGRTEPEEHLAGTFAALYGYEPEGLWAAPGRVNLIGEHTDYNDGYVLPLALPHTARAAVSRRDDGVLRLHSGDVLGGVVELRADALEPGAPGLGWAAYPAGVVWALRDAGHPVTGLDLHLSSTVPVGAGLSSSAALEIVTALALNELHGLGLRPWQLARVAQRAENVFVGMPCGIMDQTASACCTAGHALHLDTRDLTQRQVPFDLAADGLRLLVVDTRVQHALGDSAYAERRASCEEGAALLDVPALRDVAFGQLDEALSRLGDETLRRRVRHVVTENRRVEEVTARLAAGDTRGIGPLLTAGHASLRDDFEVSCPELDLAVESACAAGALGARMTGGGFGGSAIALVEEAAAEPVTKAVTAAFAAAGHREPRVFPAVPSAGARRLA
ncbi:galactokinase [Streptomyces sp. WAC 00631]|uniref:galactokinase n=1 Tax=unclassified Streptomyces TaxID=2593676 RepID=UPI000F77FE1E|nr:MULTISPECIES: galactokinase [unclassified Streptomyces]MCC5032984.1 galactokinase [Streptomyces sp. WAC 00631]